MLVIMMIALLVIMMIALLAMLVIMMIALLVIMMIALLVIMMIEYVASEFSRLYSSKFRLAGIFIRSAFVLPPWQIGPPPWIRGSLLVCFCVCFCLFLCLFLFVSLFVLCLADWLTTVDGSLFPTFSNSNSFHRLMANARVEK